MEEHRHEMESSIFYTIWNKTCDL
ncbi:hypothetical protein AVEN_205958-1, partial [Araneus ventricosus]